MTRTLVTMLFSASLLLFVVGAGQPLSTQENGGELKESPLSQGETVEVRAQNPGEGQSAAAIDSAVAQAAPNFYLNWYTLDGGGDHRLPGTSVNLGVSVGQSVSGTLAGSAYKLGLGFWFATACPIALSGDVNVNGLVSTSDIVHLVNYALKGGPPPLPCIASGDVNCNGAVSVSDIVVLVNKVLKAGPEPCNVCTTIPSLWNCP